MEFEAGQWWRTPEGTIVLVVGFAHSGAVVLEDDDDIWCVEEKQYSDDCTYLPDCTGFDWVEETYPQYRVTYMPEFYAFVRLDSPPSFTFINKDGTECSPYTGSYLWGTINERDKLTEEQALALVAKPEGTYPQYRVTANPYKFAYVRVDSPTQYTPVNKDGTDGRRETLSVFDNISSREKLTKEQALALVEKPVKTEVVKVYTIVCKDRGDAEWVVRVCGDEMLAHVKRSWDICHVVSTKEYTVDCE